MRPSSLLAVPPRAASNKLIITRLPSSHNSRALCVFQHEQTQTRGDRTEACERRSPSSLHPSVLLFSEANVQPPQICTAKPVIRSVTASGSRPASSGVGRVAQIRKEQREPRARVPRWCV